MIHHERDVREEQKYIYVALTSNNRVILSGDLYCCLLPRSVRSFVYMPLGISDRNKMVLWQGCGGRTKFSLHRKNVRSVWFVVKRRGYCCNLSGGVALIIWFTTNVICAMNKNISIWREQAIIEWSRRVISIVACCHGAKFCAHAARDFRSQQYIVI